MKVTSNSSYYKAETVTERSNRSPPSLLKETVAPFRYAKLHLQRMILREEVKESRSLPSSAWIRVLETHLYTSSMVQQLLQIRCPNQ